MSSLSLSILPLYIYPPSRYISSIYISSIYIYVLPLLPTVPHRLAAATVGPGVRGSQDSRLSLSLSRSAAAAYSVARAAARASESLTIMMISGGYRIIVVMTRT
jgi:hypothetical protein